MRNLFSAALACVSVLAVVMSMTTGRGHAAEKREVPLVFSGGHEFGRNDYGRPVLLIAAGLGVTPDQFRQAFSGVTPAKGGGPTRAEARKNKAALMKVLGPLGVTNERLDEVSNYYRFRPQEGELWKTTPAKGYAVVDGGKIEKVVLTEPGSGYSTPPKVTVQGMEGVALKANLHLDRDLKKNGSIASVELADPKPAQ
jgi:hypothetical protein